jgi:Na+/H+-dicarboxylate symporter
LIWKPGAGLLLEGEVQQIKAISLSQYFLEWIPENVIGALAEGNIIQIVIFAIIAGIGITLIEEKKEMTLLQDFLNAGFKLFVIIIKYIFWYAPIGIFALMATSIADFKGALLTEMASFLIAYTVAFVAQVVLVYILFFWVVTGLNPIKFIKKISSALVTAFTTCSSAATLPVSLQCTKEAGVKEELANFGIPLGVTFNMDSMAIEIPLYVMLGMGIMGLHPTFMQLFELVILGIIFSIGCAGIPGGGIAIAAILVNMYGLPPEVIAWIAAVFVYLDITGTTMNVWGDMVCTTVVGKIEGIIDLQKFNS